MFNKKESISFASWPTYDDEKTVEEMVTIIVQVNGKVRDRIEAKINTPIEELEKLALTSEKAQSFIKDNPVRKVITVMNKLVNIVI